MEILRRPRTVLCNILCGPFFFIVSVLRLPTRCSSPVSRCPINVRAHRIRFLFFFRTIHVVFILTFTATKKSLGSCSCVTTHTPAVYTRTVYKRVRNARLFTYAVRSNVRAYTRAQYVRLVKCAVANKIACFLGVCVDVTREIWFG